jgi:hypothetical protein
MGKYDNLAALARMGDEAGSAIRQYLQPIAKSSNVPALLAARRAMIDARPGVAIDIPLVTARGGDYSAVHDAYGLGLIDSGIDAINDGKVGGLFNPSRGRFPGVGLVMYRQGDRAARRHEVMHGYTEAARLGYPGMPAVSRAAARLPHSLGDPLDEMAATRVGGGSLLTKNWPWYASYHAKQGNYGPAAVYAGLGAAQGGAVAAGAVGSAALAAAGRELLMPEESEGLDPDEVRYLTYEDPRRRSTPASVMSQDELIERLNK